ncbi:hypothetical protein PDK09_28020, partial [Bacillus cereus]|nr:hypothetical protein [Bacillus cereus]MDA1769762.1 hypothetical protein [Bacillus cereus]
NSVKNDSSRNPHYFLGTYPFFAPEPQNLSLGANKRGSSTIILCSITLDSSMISRPSSAAKVVKLPLHNSIVVFSFATYKELQQLFRAA